MEESPSKPTAKMVSNTISDNEITRAKPRPFAYKRRRWYTLGFTIENLYLLWNYIKPVFLSAFPPSGLQLVFDRQWGGCGQLPSSGFDDRTIDSSRRLYPCVFDVYESARQRRRMTAFPGIWTFPHSARPHSAAKHLKLSEAAWESVKTWAKIRHRVYFSPPFPRIDRETTGFTTPHFRDPMSILIGSYRLGRFHISDLGPTFPPGEISTLHDRSGSP